MLKGQKRKAELAVENLRRSVEDVERRRAALAKSLELSQAENRTVRMTGGVSQRYNLLPLQLRVLAAGASDDYRREREKSAVLEMNLKQERQRAAASEARVAALETEKIVLQQFNDQLRQENKMLKELTAKLELALQEAKSLARSGESGPQQRVMRLHVRDGVPYVQDVWLAGGEEVEDGGTEIEVVDPEEERKKRAADREAERRAKEEEAEDEAEREQDLKLGKIVWSKCPAVMKKWALWRLSSRVSRAAQRDLRRRLNNLVPPGKATDRHV